MGIKIDFSDMGSDFETLEPGVYEAVITKVEEKKGPKGPYLNVAFNLTEDPDRNVADGRKAWSVFSFSKGSKWKLHQTLGRLGWTADELLDPEFELEIEDLIGRECKIQLTEPDEGFTSNNVKEVYAPDFEE